MTHKPGSFSKNFAWHGTGLRKLHAAIRNGFRDALSPVDRQAFRSDSGVEGSIVLIPINFFLHNRNGKISVDELVMRSIEHDHSAQFDRLALFAFHLNRVGSGRKILSRPAMWANEFVRDRLWSNGAWQSSTLTNESLDRFLDDRMDAQSHVRMKCRSNYRHLFALCKYYPFVLPIINTGAEQWIASALFLAWDRHVLDGGAREKSDLVDLVAADELYKLLGVNRSYAHARASTLVDLYVDVGQVDRFKESEKASVPEESVSWRQPIEVPEEAGLKWLEQEESSEVVARRSVERREQLRDRRKAGALKERYKNTCQFCDTRLEIGNKQYYSEAAHIKGLGEPHNGPDTVGNMLVLCPNHHLQFDRGVLRLFKDGTVYRIQSKVIGDPLNRKKLTQRHFLEDDCVKHHYDWFD